MINWQNGEYIGVTLNRWSLCQLWWLLQYKSQMCFILFSYLGMSSCFPQVVNKEQSNSDNVFSFSFIPGLWELNNILLLLGVAGRLKVVKSHPEKKYPPTPKEKQKSCMDGDLITWKSIWKAIICFTWSVPSHSVLRSSTFLLKIAITENLMGLAKAFCASCLFWSLFALFFTSVTFDK